MEKITRHYQEEEKSSPKSSTERNKALARKIPQGLVPTTCFTRNPRIIKLTITPTDSTIDYASTTANVRKQRPLYSTNYLHAGGWNSYIRQDRQSFYKIIHLHYFI
ncbi:hypothetical protein RhiirA4_459353 [Rhizophagus irregularis]|uniref:Uncharacterized protein n=1 Tax=Rhizophagus irregularis TaxID=588596 RepID=A0A2I1GE43_9GLOM|nr:hypothetical protein RhiirA4_459353 [Rhizophagus irregularis]